MKTKTIREPKYTAWVCEISGCNTTIYMASEHAVKQHIAEHNKPRVHFTIYTHDIAPSWDFQSVEKPSRTIYTIHESGYLPNVFKPTNWEKAYLYQHKTLSGALRKLAQLLESKSRKGYNISISTQRT